MDRKDIKLKSKKRSKTKFIVIAIILLVVIAFVIFILTAKNLMQGTGIIDYDPSVYYLSDGFHNGLLLPNHEGAFAEVLGDEYSDYSYVYYTFADKEWYYEHKEGFIQSFPTLFANTPGVMERVFLTDEYPLEEGIYYLNFIGRIDVWPLDANSESVSNIIRYIEEEEMGEEVFSVIKRGGNSRVYFLSSVREYSLFNNCNHFTFDALSHGGFDVKSSWFNFIDQFTRIRLQLMDKHAENQP
jgi:hypothetical protein